MLSYVFLVFPPYAVGGGLLKLTTNQVQSELLAEFGIESYENPLNWNILGFHIFVLLSEAMLFHALHLFIEFGWLRLSLKRQETSYNTIHYPPGKKVLSGGTKKLKATW